MLTPLLVAALTIQEPVLRLDPRLVAEAEEVWSVVAVGDNPVWPGWDASDTPLLFYFPGVQEVLVNHPSPPAGFVPYGGPLTFQGRPFLVRTGETEITTDGQNTSREFGGVQTLVVADTLSNLRPNLELALRSPHPSDQPSLTFEHLATDPYGQLGMIAHEAFHVFQRDSFAGKIASETLLLQYPTLSVENNVGVALEATSLGRALRARDEDELWTSALGFLAVRKERRRSLPKSAVSYEDGTEFNEGLAKYVEWSLTEVLEGREPGAAMAYVRDFRGYGDLSFVREELVEELVGFLTGERVVNGDPYGTSPVRFRLYYSGMGVAVLLDRMLPEWKELIGEPGTTLTGLLEEALVPRPEDLARALAEARSAEGYADLVASKTELAERGRAVAEERVRSILEGEATLLTLDYSALGAPPAGWGFSPFGITVVDPERTIYALTPVSVQLSDGSAVRQSRVAPMLHHTAEKTIRFRLSREVSPSELATALGLANLPDGPLEDLEFELPGVSLSLKRARVHGGGDELRLELLPR